MSIPCLIQRNPLNGEISDNLIIGEQSLRAQKLYGIIQIITATYMIWKYTAQTLPFYICVFVHAQSLQLCPTLCNPMDCSPPGSSIHVKLRNFFWIHSLLRLYHDWVLDFLKCYPASTDVSFFFFSLWIW